MNIKKNIFIFSKKLTEGNAVDVNKLGGKGANLAEMSRLGIPVPPGITISTDICNYFLEHKSLPNNFELLLSDYIKKIEPWNERNYYLTRDYLGEIARDRTNEKGNGTPILEYE